MKVFITIPDFSAHGGIRIIVEWANRLTKWHEVYLHPLKPGNHTYYNIDPKVKIIGPDMQGMDCLIITSPHSIDFQRRPDTPKKVFVFMQMLEHIFRPDDMSWNAKCMEFYNSPHPMFAISKWNLELINRHGTTHYIGNGVNIKDFPITNNPKDGKTILVEGWNGYNPAKDINHIGPKVAQWLKMEGYRIISFGHQEPDNHKNIPDEFYLKPKLETINQLYEKATILIKATRYDARSCSPMEAMTKGTVTARAIIKGDDDLIDGKNCLRVDYNEYDLYLAAKELLNNQVKRNELAENCYRHLKKYSWTYWMNQINKIISQ